MAIIPTSGLENYALLLLRIFIGWIFIYHGWPKLVGGKKMASQMGKPKMGGFLTFLGFAEILGGLATLIGLLTQLANIGFVIVMVGAITTKITQMKVKFSSHETTGWEFDFILLGVAIALIIFGAGSISIDAMLKFWP